MWALVSKHTSSDCLKKSACTCFRPTWWPHLRTLCSNLEVTHYTNICAHQSKTLAGSDPSASSAISDNFYSHGGDSSPQLFQTEVNVKVLDFLTVLHMGSIYAQWNCWNRDVVLVTVSDVCHNWAYAWQLRCKVVYHCISVVKEVKQIVMYLDSRNGYLEPPLI